MEFQLLTKTKILKIKTFLALKLSDVVFNIYEHDKFYAQLSWAWKKFYNLGA